MNLEISSIWGFIYMKHELCWRFPDLTHNHMCHQGFSLEITPLLKSMALLSLWCHFPEQGGGAVCPNLRCHMSWYHVTEDNWAWHIGKQLPPCDHFGSGKQHGTEGRSPSPSWLGTPRLHLVMGCFLKWVPDGRCDCVTDGSGYPWPGSWHTSCIDKPSDGIENRKLHICQWPQTDVATTKALSALKQHFILHRESQLFSLPPQAFCYDTGKSLECFVFKNSTWPDFFC